MLPELSINDLRVLSDTIASLRQNYRVQYGTRPSKKNRVRSSGLNANVSPSPEQSSAPVSTKSSSKKRAPSSPKGQSRLPTPSAYGKCSINSFLKEQQFPVKELSKRLSAFGKGTLNESDLVILRKILEDKTTLVRKFPRYYVEKNPNVNFDEGPVNSLLAIVESQREAVTASLQNLHRRPSEIALQYAVPSVSGSTTGLPQRGKDSRKRSKKDMSTQGGNMVIDHRIGEPLSLC